MRDQLCFHLKALLSNVVSNHEVQRFVGTLVNLDPRTLVLKTKELSLILKNFLLGNFDFPEGTLNHWKVYKLDRPRLVPYYDSKVVEVHHRFHENLLNVLMDLPQSSPENIKILSGMMKLGSVVTFDTPTQTEWRDIYKQISNPFSGDQSFLEEIGAMIPSIMTLIMSGRWKDDVGHYYEPITSVFGNPEKSSFAIDSRGQTSICKRDNLLAYNLNYVLRSPSIQNLYNIDPDRFITYAFTGVRAKGSKIDWSKYPVLPHEIPLSRIISIPEPNGKFRTVCLPHILLNCLSFNLGIRLKAINSHWEVQGVDSHDGTVEKLHKILVASLKRQPKDQLVFCCTDLKSYTDRAPYKGLQDRVLDYLVETKYISEFDKRLMDVICNSLCEFRNTHIRYGVGTPQGTQPSFPLGSLANGIMLYYSYYRAHGKLCHKNRLPGRIIGDDIVIWDKRVAWEYQETVSKLGIEISTHKSLESKRIIEMCSKIVHESGIFLQSKLDKLPISNVSQFVDKYPYYGKPLEEFLLRKEESLSFLLSVPKPYGLGRELDVRKKNKKIQENLPDVPLNDPTPIEKVYMTRFLMARLSPYIRDRRNVTADILKKDERIQLIPPIIIGEIEQDMKVYTQNIPWVTSLIEETVELYNKFRHSQDLEDLVLLSPQLLDNYKLLRQFQYLGLPIGLDPDRTDLRQKFLSGLKPVENIPSIVSQPSESSNLLDKMLDVPFTPSNFER